MTITEHKLDTSIEKNIITGLITSKEFTNKIATVFDINYFTNGFVRTLTSWAFDFYKSYKEPPGKHIQDIFETHRTTLKPEQADIIEKFLQRLSDNYEVSGINVDYLLSQTLEYFKKRELEITSGNVSVLLQQGKVKEAELELQKYRKVSFQTSEWINPFDLECVDSVFQMMETPFFTLPGKLGSFVGPFRKEWLVGISGGFKKGKTWFLQEFAVIAVLNNIPTAFYSLEMTKEQMLERIYKRLTGYCGDGGDFAYPCFDCILNQNGTCRRPERRNRTPLFADGEIPEFDPRSNYRPCTFCRDNNISDYQLASWYKVINREAFDYLNVTKWIERMKVRFDKLLRVKRYPRFSANVSDITNDLEILQNSEGISPEMIVVDYVDILKPENSNNKGVDKEDETWMSLARLASERKALVVTGTQINKEGQEAEIQRLKHSARWVGKYGHIDVMLGVNQTSEEKDRGVVRMNTIAHRHEDFIPERTVSILQMLNAGQVHLDSE